MAVGKDDVGGSNPPSSSAHSVGGALPFDSLRQDGGNRAVVGADRGRSQT